MCRVEASFPKTKLYQSVRSRHTKHSFKISPASTNLLSSGFLLPLLHWHGFVFLTVLCGCSTIPLARYLLPLSSLFSLAMRAESIFRSCLFFCLSQSWPSERLGSCQITARGVCPSYSRILLPPFKSESRWEMISTGATLQAP